MSKRVYKFCMMIGLAFMAASCIKETLPECPPQMVVKLVIKDANYFNIAEFPELTAEDVSQPFAHFSGTVYYELTDATTGRIVRQSDVVPAIENTPDYEISFNDLPEGKYELVAWGNVTKEIPIGTLHQNGLEHTDIYTAHASLLITPGYQTQTLQLERTKGKLVVFCRNFPAEVTQFTMEVAPVYQKVDASLNYQGSTNVQKSTALKEINETFIAPSLQGNSTKLDMSFYTATRAASPVLTIPQMDINLHRNEITAMAVDYDATGGAWEIWTFTDGEWNMIHHLDIK